MIIGGGIGFVEGIKVIIVIFGEWYLVWMLELLDGWLVNFVLFGKGNIVNFDVLWEQLCGGVLGFKFYEDWGLILVVIDICLVVVDVVGVQVVLYFDIFNEIGFVEDIIGVIVGCLIYVYYIEGVGGGYVLDIIIVVV